MAVGHVYYFLEDVFPYQRGGRRLLVTPQWLKTICDPAPGRILTCWNRRIDLKLCMNFLIAVMYNLESVQLLTESFLLPTIPNFWNRAF